MATMFPADVTSFLTTGEEATYSFLRRTARPDDKFLCWYAPDIEEREPDFILLSPDCGLVVLEVKDWLIDQLLEVDGIGQATLDGLRDHITTEEIQE